MSLKALIESLGLSEPSLFKVFVIVAVTVILHFVVAYFFRRLLKIADRSNGHWDDTLTQAALKPLPVVIWVVGIAYSLTTIAKNSQNEIFTFIPLLRDVAITICFAWFFWRLIQESCQNYLAHQAQKGDEVDYTTVDALAKLGHLLVIIAATLTVMQTLGFSVSGLLAAGGIGGFAIGFAAKDLLANFFGGLTIYLDRPFSVGDWIRSPDRDIEGVVEIINWRHTRIRRFNKNPIYVPNAVFTVIAVENPSRMSNRRIKENIGIRYDDLNNMAAIVSDVKAMLASHEDIATDKTLIVNFDAFSASSVDFLIYCFTKTNVWEEYHEIRQDILLKVAEVVAQHGAEMAFPTQTIHVENAAD
ncbi:MAG: mechanosensitive ion channel family protein [Methylophilaceae bacterium]